MQRFLVGLAGAAALLTASATAAQSDASAQLTPAVYQAGERPSLVRVDYVYGGATYCWYQNAWQGPGFYRCGYAMRRGYGWGGGEGWHGWHGGYRGAYYGHPGAGYHHGYGRGHGHAYGHAHAPGYHG